MSDNQDENKTGTAVAVFLQTNRAKNLLGDNHMTSVSASDSTEFDSLFRRFFLPPDYSIEGLSNLIRQLHRSLTIVDGAGDTTELEVDTMNDLDADAAKHAVRVHQLSVIQSMTASDVYRIYTDPKVLAEYSANDLATLKSILIDWATKRNMNIPDEWLD
jgi:hypothetical protein